MSMFDRRWLKLVFTAAVFGFSLGGATLCAQDQDDQAAASRPILDDKKKDDDKSDAKKEDSKEDDELTLEKLFPKKSPFGPSASRTSFSHDGRYGSYMYRPRVERRHGNDIFLYDFETGETHRITSVSKMAEFHSSVRKVKEDRIKKAKATLKKKSDDDKDETSKEDSEDKVDEESEEAKEEKKSKDKKKGDKDNKEEEESDKESKDSDEERIHELKEQGDWVSDKDADDEKAPRYSGVSSYSWAHNSHEMLVSSQGDIFRVKLTDAEPSIERLTRTAQFERSIRYLPDDSGYMYMADDKLYRVAFGKSFVEQIDPKLPSGETMRDYELSPDGSRLVLVSTKGDAPFSSERKIKIVNYRNRFAEVREFSRVVADDPKKSQDIYVRFYDLKGHRDESSKLVDVHHHKLTGPRDVFSTPQWSLDSNRVVFAKFDQASAQIHVLTADFPEKESDAKKDEAKKSTSEDKKDDESKDDKKELAKIVHRSLHNGGPNTPRMVSPQFLADHRHVVLLSEQSGYRHLYLLDPVYETMTPLTSGSYEVYPQDLSEDRKWMLVTSTKDHAARQQVYRINLETKEFSPISQLPGSYSSAAMSGDGQRLLANYVTFGKATELVRVDLAKEKKTQINLTDSHTEATRKLIEPIPEFFEYENRHGHTIHGQMFKPDDWKKGDKRPLLIYVYGGPLGDRKMVVDGSYSSDSYFFAYYMAKKHGYVTVTIDPRGVSGYGGLFEKSNFENIGRPQVEDLSDGVKYLIEEVGVNPNKVGIHGWSFGGFQTQMCMYLAPKVFQVGIAGAGPTEWENYNAWYTTGTVSESREGQTDQAKYSLLKLAKNLEGKMLLVHGMEDSNVLYQDTVRVYRELLKAGKETLVELFLDPTGGHSLGGDVKRLGRMKKYEEFLVRTLGSRPPKKPAGDKAADSSKKDAAKKDKSREDSAKEDSKKDVDKKKDDKQESGEVDGDKRDSENEAKRKARRAKRKQKGGRKKKDDKSEEDGDKDE